MPNFGVFGKMNLLEVLQSLGSPKGTSLRETASFDGSSKSAEPFLQGAETTEMNKIKNKKLIESLYFNPLCLWAGLIGW
jgi:hypothetical protein